MAKWLFFLITGLVLAMGALLFWPLASPGRSEGRGECSSPRQSRASMLAAQPRPRMSLPVSAPVKE